MGMVVMPMRVRVCRPIGMSVLMLVLVAMLMMGVVREVNVEFYPGDARLASAREVQMVITQT
jgi:hypothetical protein